MMPRVHPFNDNEQSSVVDTINHMFLEIETLRLERERLKKDISAAKERADYYQRQVEQVRSVLETPKAEVTATDERRDTSSPRRMRFVPRAKKRMEKCPKPEGIFARLHSTNAADSPSHKANDVQKKQ